MVRTLMAGAAALAISAGAASAHHGWGGYDSANAVSLTGMVESIDYANPHATMMLAADGKRWEVVLAPPWRMTNRGLAAGAVNVGDTVTVVGYAHKEHAAELRAETITADGKTVPLR